MLSQNSYVDYVLFDINKFKIEKEGRINLDELLIDMIDSVSNISDSQMVKFEELGLYLKNNPQLFIYNKNKFLAYIRNIIFPNYKITDCSGKYTEDTGHPDFIVQKEENIFYVELKVNQDNLRLSQLKWFSDNKDKKSKVLWLFVVMDNIKGELPDSIKRTNIDISSALGNKLTL